MNNPAQQLCLACGLCCNGVIFTAGQLQPGDDAERLRAAGLRLKTNTQNLPAKFHQPCGAFAECRCTVYAARPDYCRKFECALLKRVNSGATTAAAALNRIHGAKQRAEKVRWLLQSLGCRAEHLPLSVRFRRLSRRIHEEALNEQRAEMFGDLTLAFHDLNLALSRHFYPANG
jgi:uncharacterized protein